MRDIFTGRVSLSHRRSLVRPPPLLHIHPPEYFFAHSVSEALANSPSPPLRVSGRYLVLKVDGSFRGRRRNAQVPVEGAGHRQLSGRRPLQHVGSSLMSRAGWWKRTPAAKGPFGVVRALRPRGFSAQRTHSEIFQEHGKFPSFPFPPIIWCGIIATRIQWRDAEE